MWLKLNMKVKQGERIDSLLLEGMKIIQRSDQFCFSLDTILLAHFGSRPRGPILDLGTGTAVIPLILAARGATSIEAIEYNPIMADIAQRNVLLNQKESDIHIQKGDYRKLQAWYASGSFATVYANPPYREKSRGAYSQQAGIRRACHEETVTLEEVIKAASFALKYGGYFRMVHITERLTDILAVLRRYGIEPKRLQFVHSRLDKASKIFLMEGSRGGNPGLEILPPLVVHRDDGSYCDEILSYYQGQGEM